MYKLGSGMELGGSAWRTSKVRGAFMLYMFLEAHPVVNAARDHDSGIVSH